MAHSRFAPSAAHRWMSCPASLVLNEGLADKTSVFAEEGSLAHELGQFLLDGGAVSDFNKPLPEDMLEEVMKYVEYVRDLNLQWVQTEVSVSMEKWVSQCFGTSDVIGYLDGTLHVIDLKYGKGVPVNAAGNEQLLLYALGGLDWADEIERIESVEVHIVQPRLNNYQNEVYSLAYLEKFGEKVKKAARMALEPKPIFHAEEAACRFCKAKATCPELYDVARNTLASDWDRFEEAIEETHIRQIADNDLREILDRKDSILMYLAAIEEHVFRKILSGGSFPGYKLVAGRSPRSWFDSAVAELVLKERLGDDAYKKTLLSVAQAEKLLPKNERSEILENAGAIKAKGKPTLVPDSDRRESLSDVSGLFDAFDTEEAED